ncbi:MAG: nucleotidyltransferase family protein [Spirosomataceae bacterium]|jgi:dTDP-glucose pyrophosphorylase/CBS domain-containing protein
MELTQFLLSDTVTAREALRQLDSIGIIAPVLFIYDDLNRIVGSITDGDIRRGLLKNLAIDDSVAEFMRKEIRFFTEGAYSKSDIKSFKDINIRFVPVLDKEGRLVHLVDTYHTKANIPAMAVVMAGGRGERLMPLTEKTPKPMLKVGGKPIIEYNIEHLVRHGIRDISISIRYLGEQLQDYFKDGSHKNARIAYITEDKPLGTIGALKMIPSISQDYILVMNSDLLTDIDLESFFETFIEQEADMAVATIPYDVNIPYAVMELEGNVVKDFKEKPRYTYYSNAGIYLMKKELLDIIPENQFFDATDLMNTVIAQGKKLIADPILSYWLDIGRMEDFYKAQEDIKHLKFV